jgi:hypothetical protein
VGRGLLLAAVACTVLFTATTANAHFFSGNDLYRMCRGSIDEQEQCLGYMAGVSDGVDELRVGMGLPACVRAGVEVGQIRDVVVKYLEDNPQGRDGDAWLFAATAIGKAWNCGK